MRVEEGIAADFIVVVACVGGWRGLARCGVNAGLVAHAGGLHVAFERGEGGGSGCTGGK